MGVFCWFLPDYGHNRWHKDQRVKRTASLQLKLLPLPLKDGLLSARKLGARAVALTAEWGGGFLRPGTIPVDELSGRTLHDFKRVLAQGGLTIAAIDLPDPIRGAEGLDRIYALGVRSIEVLSDLGAPRGILSLEAAADSGQETALKELMQLGLNRGVRVGIRAVGAGWADNARRYPPLAPPAPANKDAPSDPNPSTASGESERARSDAKKPKLSWPDGLGVDLDFPELRRFGQDLTSVLEAFKGAILHVRCDDYELNLQARRPTGLLLPQKLAKAEPESLDELTIFLEHAGFEGCWTLKQLPPTPLGADWRTALKSALAKLQRDR